MKMEINKNLIIVLLVLALIGCLVTFWIVPTVKEANAKTKAQCLQEGVDSAIANIIGQLQSKGFVTIIAGNQSINLVPVQNSQG